MGSIRHFRDHGNRENSLYIIGFISKDLLIILVIILVATAGFGLGRLSVKKNTTSVLKIGEIELNTVPASVYASRQETNTPIGDGSVVASKNSTKYHYPWCSGAQRIKEENKIYFNSIEEAKSAGYEPAGNCQGLK